MTTTDSGLDSSVLSLAMIKAQVRASREMKGKMRALCTLFAFRELYDSQPDMDASLASSISAVIMSQQNARERNAMPTRCEPTHADGGTGNTSAMCIHIFPPDVAGSLLSGKPHTQGSLCGHIERRVILFYIDRWGVLTKNDWQNLCACAAPHPGPPAVCQAGWLRK